MYEHFLLPTIPSRDELSEESIRLARSIHAPRTLTEYASDWAGFVTWCSQNARSSLPAADETVARYVTDLLRHGRKIKTARRHLSALLYYHRKAGCASPVTPEVRAIITGAQRLRGEQPQQKAAITVDQLRAMMESIRRPEPYASRDRAVLVFGFATALRRSSIVSLDLADTKFTEGGMIVHVRREKQDQAGVGRNIGVPRGVSAATCPIAALKRWLDWRGAEPGALFWGMNHGVSGGRMYDNTVARIVKRAVDSIGLDPDRYGAHSLRAGFVTAALGAGAGEILTARHTGHRSLNTLRLYLRPEDPFRANACAAIGL